ncbi:MAG: DUF4388 domain-containing protein [Deltaproteobacteria bacterium]|nr:DUF4388 domain-containing protein [Deltaproteobacteria bacterium]MBW2387105.1 DUF4388 domain-containing protein [Deltaproteobacteria bacterium]MBW2726072.1 DUF4388 domain-containing protein [Deltaproteobacteria bacterium]
MSEPSAKPFQGSLTLCDELRSELGLEANDTLRLLRADVRTVLLERVRESSGFAVPWDRDLVLSASVESFPLADILSMLHRASKSGFLLFGFAGHEKAVYLHRGEVVFAASNQGVDRLGECLFRSGILTLEQLRDAEKRWSPNHRLGKVLVEREVLTPRELWNGVKLQVEEIVRSLFAYTTGSVYFWEGEVQPDNVVRLALPTRKLISQGLRRRDELLRFLAALEDPNVNLVVSADAAEGLSGNAHSLCDALRLHLKFAAACRAAGLDPLSGARIIQMLRLAGTLTIERDAEDGRSAEDRYSEGQAALVGLIGALVKLIGELSTPLVAADGPDAVFERMSGLLEETAARYPELLGEVQLGFAGGLDPDQIEKAALKIPGDRERCVRDALGEMITYLEFELRNHPRIEDPEIYLDAVEDLRAKLDL